MSQRPHGHRITRRGFFRELAAAGASAYVLAGGLGEQRALAANPAGGEVTNETVVAAIRRGIANLRARQRGDGAWPEAGRPGGSTALALLALLNAGVPADDAAVRRGLSGLLDQELASTYVVALECMVMAAVGEQGYQRRLQHAADWLIDSQLPNGMWTYSPGGGRGDNSNTQFALLGLHEAAKAGARVPRQLWQRSNQHYVNTQLNDGGWNYVYSSRTADDAYGSMTAAGVASLFITGEQMRISREAGFIDGAAPNCGRVAVSAPIQAGINWLGRNFSVTENPRRGDTWRLYYLYALERVGMTGGMRYIGRHDWYRQGAAHLVAVQQPDGSWGQTTDTAFALLFLAKGNRPVLIQKLRHAGRWDLDPHDAANLTDHIGDKLGKRPAWQTLDIDAPLEDWLVSPIVYLQGHEFPALTAEQTQTMQRYIEGCGTLWFEACCGRRPFREGFAAWAEEAFPQYALRTLEADHPVFDSYYPLDQTHGLMGLDVGCRTSVFFLPNDLSCLWEQRTIPGQEKLTTFAFQLGVNLAAYATGKQPLADRLTQVLLPAPSTQPAQPARRGAVQIARLAHEGDYNADPRCLANLAELAARQARVDVVTRDRAVRATDKELFNHPLLFMTGHFAFEMTDEEVAALKTYLQRGGTLLAEACCGREPFDGSFRALAARLADGPLSPLPGDHAVFAGQVGRPLGPVRLRPRLAELMHSETLDRPRIEAATISGRTAILYSRWDFSCGLEGDKPYSCLGYADDDAKALAVNLLLYAVSF